MAVSDSTQFRPPYPAIAFTLRGVALDVVHVSGGQSVTRTAVVEIVKTTFLERGGTRKTSSASVTFLEHVAVRPADTIQLPDGEPMKVIRVLSKFGVSTQGDGRLTEVGLA